MFETVEAYDAWVDSAGDVVVEDLDGELAGRSDVAWLEGLEPGMMLAAVLSRIEVDRLSDYDRVVVLRAHERMVAHHQALSMQAMTAIADTMRDLFYDDPGIDFEAASTEIRAALTLTRRAADVRLGVAMDVRDRLPAVWDLLREGRIDLARARAIIDGVAHLSDEQARRVVDRVVDGAGGWTTGQLRARVRTLCVDLFPDEAAERFEAAVRDRRVVVEAGMDGTANLVGLDLPPERVMAASDRIHRLARSLRRHGETRNMDQLRADVFLDLLEGTGHQKAGRGVVEIRVDATTLAGLNEASADLGGYGPVIADIARQIAEGSSDSEWRYLVTDPQTGEVTHSGITRRRPTPTQRRIIETRHPVCAFPGCRMPARACDLDHTIPWSQGGITRCDDLAPNCRHDHIVRHKLGWTYRRLPDRRWQWTSPLGHTYTSGQPP